jgi:response regulator NasT
MSGIELGSQLRERSGVPFLCLSDRVDPEMVARAAEEGALGYLVKPLAVQQIMPSIEAALTRAAEIRKLRESEAQLNAALAGSREIGMVVGLLMQRDLLDRTKAFELLRNHARSQRRPVAEVASGLLESAEKLNKINNI